jgi:NAD(P)-dependent dehydrogenase (short-subunit alcohol dehydrogenase family)
VSRGAHAAVLFEPGIDSAFAPRFGPNCDCAIKLLGNYKPGELMAEWVKNIPMARAGTGEDVSGLVAFLACAEAAYITGQTINVDGGLIMS